MWFNPRACWGSGTAARSTAATSTGSTTASRRTGPRNSPGTREATSARRAGHDLLGRQERVRALGRRRSRAAWRDRAGPQRRRPGGAGRDRVPLLRVHADPGQGGADQGPARRYRGGDVPARHQSGERPAASYSLRHLQCGPHPRRRQVAGHAPVPGIQLGQGCGRGLPQCPGLEPARASRRSDEAARSRFRLHPDRGHAGRPAGLLVEAAQDDRRQGRESWASRRSATPRAWPASTS